MSAVQRTGLRAGLALVVILGLLGAGCTETDVEAEQTINVNEVDNLLDIVGEVCTEPPEDSDFPVKIMFIVDCSGSLQQTDEGDHRVEAIRQVVRRFADNPQVYFNIIRFNGQVSVLTDGFELAQAVDNDEAIFGSNGLMQADSQTDYQGALGTAYQELLKDMMDTDRAELTRTKYVVIFFSDGTPDPVCYGCVTDPPSHPRYSPACHEDLHLTCTLGDRVLTEFQMDNFQGLLEREDENWFPEIEGGVDYNNPYQLFQLVRAIMELKETFKVGELRFHTAFLYCRDQFGNPTSALCAAAELAYNLDPDRGRALLREMARIGEGTFRDFTGGADVDFLSIDYTSIKRNYAAKNLLVSNVTAFPGASSFLPDSDTDGLPDAEEAQLGLNARDRDSDDDGYGDFIEVAWAKAGFDPLDASKPDEPCADTSDGDGDGLVACEEALYKTDKKLTDTDADGFPDFHEVIFGTDPLRDDMTEDLDADGRRNADELLVRSHPARSDADLWKEHRYWYDLAEGEPDNQDRRCYQFSISKVSLVTTSDRNGAGSRGYNDILVWFDVAAYDDPYDTGRFLAACVRAQYIRPDFKVPFDGRIELTHDDFKPPQDLDMSFGTGDCVEAE